MAHKTIFSRPGPCAGRKYLCLDQDLPPKGIHNLDESIIRWQAPLSVICGKSKLNGNDKGYPALGDRVNLFQGYISGHNGNGDVKLAKELPR